MRRRWHQARKLSAAEWWVVGQAFILLPMVSLSVKIFGLKKTQAYLLKFIPTVPKKQHPPDPIIAQIVNGTARYVRANCLARSLALWWLLRRRGIESLIRIGIRKENRSLLAHAWVEMDHHVLNDRLDIETEYATISEFSDQWSFTS